jgi:hypothetical protein
MKRPETLVAALIFLAISFFAFMSFIGPTLKSFGWPS